MKKNMQWFRSAMVFLALAWGVQAQNSGSTAEETPAASDAPPSLWVSSGELRPGAVVEFRFPKSVVSQPELGTSIKADLFSVKPALAGRIEWIMPNVARFHLEKVPAMGQTYVVNLAKGFTYDDGTAIAPRVLGRMVAEGFRLEYSSILNRYAEGFNMRDHQYLLRFNADVSPADCDSFLFYQDSLGNKVAARVAEVGEADFGYRYATWEERYTAEIAAANKPVEQPAANAPEVVEEEIPAAKPVPPANMLVVSPVNPLPIGDKWQLILLKGLPDEAGNHEILKNLFVEVGDIKPLEIKQLNAVVLVDTPRYLQIEFTKRLSKEMKAETLAEAITITPAPENLRWEITPYGQAVAHGDFSAGDHWEVAVKANGSVIGLDGTVMEKDHEGEARFYTLDPSVILPLYSYQSQLAKGKRDYPIRAVNMDKIRVRVKYLEGEQIVRAIQGYRYYTGQGKDWEQPVERQTYLPYELFQGKPVLDRTFEPKEGLDKTFAHDLKWDELLATVDPALRLGPGVFFIDVEGEESMDALDRRNSDRDPEGYSRAQRIVQLTDLGVAWKVNETEALFYAFSCETGKPVEGAAVEIFGEDAVSLGAFVTDASGVARVPRPAEVHHVKVSKDKDSYTVAYDTTMPTVDMWYFPVRYDWMPKQEWKNKAFMFTDRNLYKPGEEVHLKGIARLQKDTEFKIPEGAKATLTVQDSQENVIFSREIEFGVEGSFDATFRLPPSKVGDHSAILEFASVKSEEEEEWWEAENRTFTHYFSVEEFRRNTFEINAEPPTPAPGQNEIVIDYSGRYFMGQPLKDSAVTWTYSTVASGFYPEKFRDYLFGDHNAYDPYYWYHYFGYRDGDFEEWEYSAEDSRQTESGEGQLDAEGKFSLGFTLPAAEKPGVRNVTVSAEVTDINQQTLTKKLRFTSHSSGVYVGLSRSDHLQETGKELSFDLVAVTQEGEKATVAVPVHVTVERKVHDTTRVATGEGVTTNSEERLEMVWESDLVIDPAKPKNVAAFTPKDAGEHVITVTGKDAEGLDFKTVVTHQVYGAGDFSWAYENGMRIRLVPEKKIYKPGEVAKILVLTPVDGTALVTVERSGVLRHFLRDLKSDQPVVEIPVESGDAPNVFVSVLLIKGSKDNLREDKEPVLKLGYCELTIEPTAKTLQVNVTPALGSVRPAEAAVINGEVLDSQGKPVVGAEVVLYAEDEGVLSVMGYENPEPVRYFHSPVSIGLDTGTSLDNFIPENKEMIEFMMKGMSIGGGGFTDLPEDTRKNFNPCAYWNAGLKTDARGRFTATFNTPDTLTRYRIIAVVMAGTDYFGTGLSELTVNKPVMIDPVVPRYANEGDQLVPKAIVHNTSPHAGKWEITLTAGSETQFEGAALADRSKTHSISLAAGESQAVPFPLSFIGTGEAKWLWEATPVEVNGAAPDEAMKRELTDRVQSIFQVAYPRPLLREEKFVRLTKENPKAALSAGFTKELLDGRGQISIDMSANPLMEGGGAIKHLLKYPYGCVEQTTGSLMPWFAVRDLKRYIPDLDKTEETIKTAIQKGADRLLSMQTASGGLGYWPGAERAEDWACAYGGMGLILSKQNGAYVPDQAVEKLTAYVSERLRDGQIKDSWSRDTFALSLYFLALAGKAEPGFHDKLMEVEDTLSPAARGWLAMAMNLSGPQGAEAGVALLKRAAARQEKDGEDSWMPDTYLGAVDLLARATLMHEEADTDKVFAALLLKRGREGHWGNTFSNAWGINALAAYARGMDGKPMDSKIVMEGSGEDDIALNAENPSANRVLALAAANQTNVELAEGNQLYARVTLESKPEMAPLPPLDKGFTISRNYELWLPDGTVKPVDKLVIGDVVKVTLKVRATGNRHYVVIDDPLPSVLEGINENFASQAAAGRAAEGQGWMVSHQEIRDDRVVFFSNYMPKDSEMELVYLARVTGEGTSEVAPAKVEAMYQPERYGLSSSFKLTAGPREVALDAAPAIKADGVALHTDNE